MEKLEKKDLISRLLPFILTIFVIVIDQVTKAIIVKTLPIQPGSIYAFGGSYLNDFLRIIHVRNTGVAFSIGANWNDTARRVLFSVIPTLVLIALSVIVFRSKEFTKFQRWTIAGIIGGGFGNIIDRIFRPAGVVDFVDVKVYGLFGMERWPTWNMADAAVVVCGILLVISFLISTIKEEKAKKNKK